MQEKILELIDALRSGEYPEKKINYVINHLNDITDEETLDSLFILGDALIAGGLNDYAEKVYKRLYELTDHDDEILAYLCDLYIADNRLDEALSLVNEAEKTTTTLMVKAEIFQQLNMSDVSIRSLFQAKELDDDPIIDFAIAEVYFNEGDLAEANRHYQLLTTAGIDNINHVDINLRLAEINMNMSDLETAEAYFDAAQDENFSNDDYYRKALMYYQLKEYDKAKSLLDKVLSNEPYYINGYLLLMNIHETEHNLTEAEATLEQYLKEDDTNPLIYFHLGRLNFRQNNNDEAVAYFKQSIALDEDYDDAYLMLFETLLKTDETEQVEEILHTLDTHALSGESLYLLAKIEQHNENDENALKFYEDASHLIGDSVEFYIDYYYYLTEIMSPERLNVLDKLIQLDPTNDEWLLEKERIMSEEDDL
jgi:tetratricopeptide (TPR) repeat protein